MSRTLTAGVIGVGAVGVNSHLPAYLNHQQVERTVIADIDSERRTRVQTDFDIAAAYDDGAALFEQEPLDVVSICTPPSTHEEFVIMAAKNGTDICCEKPLATNAESARRAYTAALDAGVETHMGYFFRHTQNAQKVIQLVDSGVVGRLESLSFCRHGSYAPAEWSYDPAAGGGGVVRDYFPHSLDLFIELFDTTPSVESVMLQSRRTSAVEDFASVSLSFDGSVVSGVLGWSDHGRSHLNTLSGSQGILEFDETHLHGEIMQTHFDFKYGQLPTISIGQLFQLWLSGSQIDRTRRVSRFLDYLTGGSDEYIAPMKRGVEIAETIDTIYDRATWG